MFVASDESAFILGSSVCFHLEEARAAHLSIVVVPGSGADVVADKVVFLVVAAPEQVEQTRVSAVADRLQNHIVAFLYGDVADILHCLDEGKSTAVGFASALVQMLVVRVLVVQVVAGPELH